MLEEEKPVLVTGATGYVGGRLVPRLLDAGYRVRVLVRDPSRLQGRPCGSGDTPDAADFTRPQQTRDGQDTSGP